MYVCVCVYKYKSIKEIDLLYLTFGPYWKLSYCVYIWPIFYFIYITKLIFLLIFLHQLKHLKHY